MKMEMMNDYKIKPKTQQAKKEEEERVGSVRERNS